MPVKHQDPFALELKAWFESVLTGPDGKPRIPYLTLAKLSGVAVTTIYRMRDGKGDATKQESIDKIAGVLGVPAPEIMRVLLVGERPPAPVGALEVVASLESSLKHLRGLIADYTEFAAAEAAAEAQAGPTSPDADKAAAALASDRENLEALEQAKRRSQPRKPRRRAGGKG